MTRAVNFTQAQSVVYFVQIGKHVKIGVSCRFKSRLQSFRNAAVNVDVLLVIPGDRDLEQRIHGLLAETRVERELFHREQRVLWFIELAKHKSVAQAIQHLEDTTPKAREKQKQEYREQRTKVARLKRLELDAYYASLVAERKQKLGW